jgi:DNA-binding XRE family transcriptional regulator
MEGYIDDMREILSYDVKIFRARKGLAQERPGLVADVDIPMVSNIGRKVVTPILTVLMNLANCLDVHVTDLLIRHQAES